MECQNNYHEAGESTKSPIVCDNSIHEDNYNIHIDYVEVAQNTQGNYNNYVLQAIKSIIPLKSLNYSKSLDVKKLILPETNLKTLILDLDETLIHSDFDGKYKDHDHTVTFISDNEEISVPVLIRPGLFEFIKNISEHFEIIVFTAGVKDYADAVLNYLDPDDRYFKHRFYRHDCINIANRVFIKDLRIFVNRREEDIIIVDNSLYSFSNQISNGVLINSFYNDKDDRELFNLLNYLCNYLREVEDVRLINEQVFNFSTIMNEFMS
jgi:Dullard-like phosphatase family protein